jgi:hypothetical protein
MLAKAGLGLRFNEHLEGDGPTVFAHARKLGLEGIVSKRKDSRLPFRPLARLAQNEEPGCAGREAGGGRALGEIEWARPSAKETNASSSALDAASCKLLSIAA